MSFPLLPATCAFTLFSLSVLADDIFSPDGELLYPLVCFAQKYTVSSVKYPSKTNPVTEYDRISAAFFKPDGHYRGGPGVSEGKIVMTQRAYTTVDVVVQRGFEGLGGFLESWAIESDGTKAMSSSLSTDSAKVIVWTCEADR